MEQETNEQLPHPDFIKGYNQGYIIAQHEPELAEKLAQAMGDTERGKGFQGGRTEYLQEKSQEKSRIPDWLAKDYYQNLNKEADKDAEPDKDHADMEKD